MAQRSLNFLIDPSWSQTNKKEMKSKEEKRHYLKILLLRSSSLNDENQNHHPNKSDRGAHEFAQIIGNPAGASEC